MKQKVAPEKDLLRGHPRAPRNRKTLIGFLTSRIRRKPG